MEIPRTVASTLTEAFRAPVTVLETLMKFGLVVSSVYVIASREFGKKNSPFEPVPPDLVTPVAEVRRS